MHRAPSSLSSAFVLVVGLVGSACSTSPQLPSEDPDAGAGALQDSTPAPAQPAASADAPDAAQRPPPDPDEAQPPVLTSVNPNRATVGAVGPQIVVAGQNFVARSIVQLDGAPLATTFVNDGELRATIPTSKLAAVGTLRLSVGTSAPGGGASKEVAFQVENPVPTVTSLAPLTVVAGAEATALHVHGVGFVVGAKIVIGATLFDTQFTSDTELVTTLPKTLLSASTSLPVIVRNPTPGGGDSSAVAFIVANPSAGVDALTPPSAFVGAKAFDLSVQGYGFVAASVVTFNGTALATSFVDPTHLSATVTASLLTGPGDFAVGVQNPPPGGGLGTPSTFHITYPKPQAQTLSPAGAARGAGAIDVVIEGTGFYPASQITFDGVVASTTFVDDTHLEATLDATQTASAGSIKVRVINPNPGGGSSFALPFLVNNPLPALSALAPSSVSAGASDTQVTITGTSFVPESSVTVNGVLVASSYVDASTLTATVPSTYLASPGSVALRVVNAAPGGGTTSPLSLVVGCNTSGVDVALGTLGAVKSLTTDFATAPKLPVFADASYCLQSSLLTDVLEPARSWVVQNTTNATATLSAWADCTNDGKGDAFLTFYRRPTPPTTTGDRLVCEGAIAEGINGNPGFSSPDSGASMWCPGLTKANGGGLVLSACEKAVVHVQAYDDTSTTQTMPPVVKVELE